MSQDGRYKNFACRQRLVQNPNYVDQESKAATKNVGPAATTLTTSGHNHTGNNNHNNNHHHSSTNVSSKKSNVVSSPISSYNHHHNTSHTNGPAAVTGNNNSNSASNHDHTSSHQHSSHQSHSGNNGTLSTLALIELGQHRLQYRYNLWFSKRLPGKLTSSQFYDQTLKLLSTFGTVEQFWSIYSYLLRPAELPGHFDFHLFKEGIKPMWEDEANKRGGKWIIRLKKGISSRCWENLVLAILGMFFFKDFFTPNA